MPKFSEFLNKYHRVIAILFGIFLCSMLIFSTEVFLTYLDKIDNTKSFFETSYFKPFIFKDKFDILWVYQGDHRVIKDNKKTGEVIYDALYSIDQFGKRDTPVKNKDERKLFVLFFGCSFVFGDGLQNDETAAYEVGKLSTNFMPYNFGLQGDGPFDILAKIENVDFHKQIKEQNGKMVYTFMDAHLFRVLGTMSIMRSNQDRVFYRECRKGELAREGTFYKNRTFLTRFYRVLLKSQILKKLKVRHIFPIREKDIKLTALAINTLFQKFKNRYPGVEVYLLIYPGSKYKDRLLKYINIGQAGLLDYSKLFDINDEKFHISKYDRHPSHLANQVLAQNIVNDIGLK